jgi:DNA-binding PadR family transcriptional regulator
MTSRNSAARDGHNQGATALDLSSVFGAAAASSLPRFLPRRTTDARAPEEPTSDADEPAAVKSDAREPETMEDHVQDPRSRRAPAAARPPRTAVPTPVVPRRSDAPVPRRRRFRVVTVRDRQHVDVLLLAAATRGPANGPELIDLVRKGSGGLFMLSVGTVYHELHRLTDNRLMQVRWSGGARRYLLTPLGRRVLATRRREWEAFSHGFDRVLEAADDGDRS